MAKRAIQKPDKTANLNRLLSEINKKAGETVIARFGDIKEASMPRISTTINTLDLALGGGIPKGRITELYGLPSSGKTLISLLTIAEAQRQGLDAVYIDLEESFDPVHASALGVDVNKLILAQSLIGEDMFDIMFYALKAKPGIIVVDSVAAIQTRSETEESVEKAFMAPRARLMSRGIPKLIALNRETAIVFINQIRATMAMWGAQSTTTGGNALKFYSSIRVSVASRNADKFTVDGKKISETNPVVGQIIKCSVIKNKTAVPFKDASFKYWYDERKIETVSN